MKKKNIPKISLKVGMLSNFFSLSSTNAYLLCDMKHVLFILGNFYKFSNIFFLGQPCCWFLKTKLNSLNLSDNMFEKVGNYENTEFHIHHGHFPGKNWFTHGIDDILVIIYISWRTSQSQFSFKIAPCRRLCRMFWC